MDKDGLKARMDGLKRRLRALDGGKGLAIAYSGGLDSRFLLHACGLAGVDAVCLHFTGPHIRSDVTAKAVAGLEHRRTPYLIAQSDPLALEAVRNNRADRCYHCKRLVFGELAALAGGKILCDGSNKSDLAEYRPGRKALLEANVRSPLADCGIGKDEIRELGKMYKMDDPEQPSQSCLLTRFEYDMPLTGDLLDLVGALERDLERLLAAHSAKTGRNAPLNFRLRAFKDEAGLKLQRLELHLETGVKPEPGLYSQLALVMGEHEKFSPVIRLTEKVSGFFDRATGR